jgi:isoleucyl-tRNA synthetase
VQIFAKANFPVLGKRLGPKMKSVAAAISKLSRDELLKLESGESIGIEGEAITQEGVDVRRSPKPGHEQLQTDQLISIELDPTVTEAQIREGLSREVIRRVQMARKNADLNLDDRIELNISCRGDIESAVKEHLAKIQSETLALKVSINGSFSGSHSEKSDIDGEPIGVSLGLAQLQAQK